MRPSLSSADPATTSAADVERLIDGLRQNTLGEEDRRLLERLLRLLLSLVHLLEQKNASLARLKRLLFGPKSEKRPPSPAPRSAACGVSRGELGPTDLPESTGTGALATAASRGHGRHPASAYPGATYVVCEYPTRHAGDRCPDCARGTLLDTHQPTTALRFTAQPLGAATCYQ